MAQAHALPQPAGLPAPRLIARHGRALLAGALLCAIVAAGAAVRVDNASDHKRARSADERAYLTLARDLQVNGSYGGHTAMNEPLHWPPGAPMMFALARNGSGAPFSDLDPQPIYDAQALVGSLGILAAFGLAALLAGVWAGVAAAAAVAFYPPLAGMPSQALSEPLGGLALAAAMCALVWAARKPAWWRFALAGALTGATALVRADLLPIVAVLTVWVLIVVKRSQGSWRPAAAGAGALVAAALLALAPWTVQASRDAGRFVPISTGGSSALYAGTFLPGGGTVFGLKRELGAALRRSDHLLANTPNYRLPDKRLLDFVASRHPGLSRESALLRSARHNISVYGSRDPIGFIGMLGAKAARMWTTPYRGPYHRLSSGLRGAHIALVSLALIGLIGGVALRGRRGTPGLGGIACVLATSTAMNAVLLSEPRHLLVLLPVLFAGGAGGWAVMARAALGRAHAAQQAQTP